MNVHQLIAGFVTFVDLYGFKHTLIKEGEIYEVEFEQMDNLDNKLRIKIIEHQNHFTARFLFPKEEGSFESFLATMTNQNTKNQIGCYRWNNEPMKQDQFDFIMDLEKVLHKFHRPKVEEQKKIDIDIERNGKKVGIH